MRPLYRIETRQKNFCTFLSVVCMRGKLEVKSSEKALPPVIEYDAEGNIQLLGPKEIVEGMHNHPYKPNSKEFTRERLADLEVASLYKHLEHFPTLNQEYIDGVSTVHPIAESIYAQLVYLKPNAELAEQLSKMGYLQKAKYQTSILDKVTKAAKDQYGLNIDLFSVPKRKIGTFGYLAEDDGIAKIAKTFSFGFHNAIPCDRIARELSSLKSCERFINPQELPFELNPRFKPFVSMLRVAIIGTEYSMLDSGDLFQSGIPKIASKLSRKKIIKDVSQVPEEQRNIVYKPFRSGIEAYHEEERVIDESEQTPGTIRLIFPGGVKIASQLVNGQATDEAGENVDLLMGFETFAKKGAIACFAMKDPANYSKEMTAEDCIEYFKTLTKEKIFLNGKVYEGYIVNLPVMRPGQRYTELSKASNSITVDLIAKAILGKKFVVSSSMEKEYKDLIELRHAILQEIKLKSSR